MDLLEDNGMKKDYSKLLKVRFKPIKGFPDYVIGDDGTVLKSSEIIDGQVPLNEDGEIQIISPYYSKRDNVTRVNLFNGDIRKTPDLHNLVANHHMRRTKGKVVICKNGDYRNCQLGNLLQVDRGHAMRFKRVMFGPNRYTELYKAFLADPRPQVFYGFPIDVQEYIVERGVVDWKPEILEF